MQKKYHTRLRPYQAVSIYEFWSALARVRIRKGTYFFCAPNPEIFINYCMSITRDWKKCFFPPAQPCRAIFCSDSGCTFVDQWQPSTNSHSLLLTARFSAVVRDTSRVVVRSASVAGWSRSSSSICSAYFSRISLAQRRSPLFEIPKWFPDGAEHSPH